MPRIFHLVQALWFQKPGFCLGRCDRDRFPEGILSHNNRDFYHGNWGQNKALYEDGDLMRSEKSSS
ncbi:hypothetical protein [[Phormidium] sp. ETS-05]|uniref:hypothetical protein n=1 Tax=[Phormidium] sp. ETS-05 TaxID=222819 RepID=UPI0018EF27BF|nr:hypothetical protein [[Phormidium] sp. ETS-05]